MYTYMQSVSSKYQNTYKTKCQQRSSLWHRED